jgi:hypothetical protein
LEEKNKMKKKDKFEENACEFKNETACEEELDEDEENLEEAEKDHFDEKDEKEEDKTECDEEEEK